MSENIAMRIREIREKLGFNQEAFGAIGGVKKLTQLNYEKGASSPTADYLAALSKIGVDVLYLITGQSMTATLEGDELTMVKYYRSASEPIKKAAMGVLLSAQPPVDESKNPSITANGSVQIANKKNAIQIGGNNTGTVINESKGRKRK